MGAVHSLLGALPNFARALNVRHEPMVALRPTLDVEFSCILEPVKISDLKSAITTATGCASA